MDKFKRVEKPKPEIPIHDNEIRITTQGLIRNYISYASTLLQEKHAKEIVLKAMGQAISKTVAIAELIKKRIPNLHQDIVISSVSITDVFAPIEEGLVDVETKRQVSMISITLSFNELNKNSPGYQAPSQYDQQPKQKNYPSRQDRGIYNTGYNDSYGHGRVRVRGGGRGRGRGQSWGRGGYGSYQDNGGYSNWGRGGGRGRGRGVYNDGGYQYQGVPDGDYQYQGGRDGGYRGGRGGGYRGGRDGGYRGGRDGGYRGGRDGGYGGGRDGGYLGGRGGGYRGGRGGGYRGGRDGGYRGDRDGGYRGGPDGGYRGGYQGGRDGGYQGDRDGYQGGRGGGRVYGREGRGRGHMGGRYQDGANQA